MPTFAILCNVGTLTSPAKSEHEISISVDNSLVEKYNQQHETKYAVLPENLVQFCSYTLTIKANECEATEPVRVTLNPEEISKLDSEVSFLIPVVLSSVNKGETRPSINASVTYLKLNFMITTSMINDEANEIVGTPGDGQGWTVINCSENLDPNQFDKLFDESVMSWNRRWDLLTDDTTAKFTVDLGSVSCKVELLYNCVDLGKVIAVRCIVLPERMNDVHFHPSHLYYY